MTVNKQSFGAAKRLVANIMHKAKSLYFGNEITMSTSSRHLFLKGSPPLPSMYPLCDLPSVFSDHFLQKVQFVRADLDQQSLSLTSCRLTDLQVYSSFHSFHPITEA